MGAVIESSMRETLIPVIVSSRILLHGKYGAADYIKLDYLIILFTMIYAGKQVTTAVPFVRHMLYAIM